MGKSETGITTLKIRTADKGESKLTLTNERVYARFERGWLGQETRSIPLSAITYVVVSWSRATVWIGLALGSAIASFIVAHIDRGIQIVCWLLAVGLALVFVFYKPRKLWIQAGSSKLGGTPESADKAEDFVRQVMLALPTEGSSELPRTSQHI